MSPLCTGETLISAKIPFLEIFNETCECLRALGFVIPLKSVKQVRASIEISGIEQYQVRGIDYRVFGIAHHWI
mgnify:CR=1 FL=1